MPSSVYRAKASKELQPRSVDMLCGLGNMLAIPGGSIEQLEGGVVCCMLHGVHMYTVQPIKPPSDSSLSLADSCARPTLIWTSRRRTRTVGIPCS